jgi:hypothetical protein
VIDGGRGWLRPQLIVIDAWSRGCSGTSIAAGLRDLGITIPIVLVGHAPLPADRTLRIVPPEAAEAAVVELASATAVARPCSETVLAG